ncbi:MAG: M48 family metalloprotease [Acidobacteria bacterium]|nr:M48 family metalloprotease [Acidobacteriota bacterium]
MPAQNEENDEKASPSTNKNQKKSKNKKKDVDAIGDRNVGSGINFYSLEKEIALGKQLAQEIERQARLIDDPIISEYINRIGQNLVRNSDAKVPFTIKVLDTEEPNAMSLPGGFFFVNAGLIALAESESEIAGAMAHEIAHVAARHGTRQATRGQVVNLATIPLIFMGGWTGYGIRQAAGLAIPLGFLQFSRAFEREADQLGLQYLFKAGYDPNSFVDFFEKMEKLEKKKPGTLSKAFRSHPMTEDRIEAAQKEIQQILPTKPEYVVNTSEFLDVKARLMSLHARRKIDDKDKDANRPRLRKATTGGTIPVEGDNKGKPGAKEEDDDRPTLKRR